MADFAIRDTSPSDSSAEASWTSPGAGITGGYNGNDRTLRAFIIFFCGLAMYNALELIIMVLLTFRRWRGLYFWALLVSAMGIIPYAIGFLLKFMNITTGDSRWLAVVFLTIGWYPMITGQSLVLWSRLNLVVHGLKGERVIFWTKWMIIIDAIILHIPTTVLTFGANGDVETTTFEFAYNVMEKIQMIGFFIQEVILSSIYIVATVRLLRESLQPRTRTTMLQLIWINAVIIFMDLGLLGLECASLYILETLLKGVIYSIKLKLEFAILGKLIKFVKGPQSDEKNDRDASVGFVTTSGYDASMSVNDFVDLSRVRTDVTHPSATRTSDSIRTRRKSSRAHGIDFEYDMARFEHVEDLSTLREVSGPPTPSQYSPSRDSHISQTHSRNGYV